MDDLDRIALAQAAGGVLVAAPVGARSPHRDRARAEAECGAPVGALRAPAQRPRLAVHRHLHGGGHVRDDSASPEGAQLRLDSPSAPWYWMRVSIPRMIHV